MPDASQPNPGPKNTAGYRPLVPIDFSRGMGTSAFAYAAAAAGLGLAVGVVIAFTAGHARAAAAPRVSDALLTHSSIFSPLPAVYAASSPSLLSKVDPAGSAGLGNKPAAGALLMPVAAKTTAGKPFEHHKHHSGHKAWTKLKFLGKLTRKARRKPYVSETTVAAPDQTALDRANAAAASGPFFLGIEGDVTIAGYEPNSGTIQTYEGSTYILAKNAPGTGSINWQNYPFNVHYRCDEIGDCTLIRGHSTATAKLTR